MSRLNPEFGSHYPKLNVDYGRVKADQSVWGKPNPRTIELVRQHMSGGRILDLAGGDGRYSVPILEIAPVVTNDIDLQSLERALERTPEDLKSSLYREIFLTPGPIPHPANSFDGVLSTGLLYLFPEEKIRKITSEIRRVLKREGTFILEFLTNRSRVDLATGRLVVGSDEVNYTQGAGSTLLFKVLSESGFNLAQIESQEVDTIMHIPLVDATDINCRLTGNLLIAVAKTHS